MASKRFCVDDVIGLVCNEKELEDVDESDESDLDDFDGYIDGIEMERLIHQGDCSDTDKCDEQENFSDVCSAMGGGSDEISTCNAIEDMEWTVDDDRHDSSTDTSAQAQPQLSTSTISFSSPYISEISLNSNSSNSIQSSSPTTNSVDSPTSSDQSPSTSISSSSSSSENLVPPVGKCTRNMDNKSPLEFFKLLVTDDIVDNIVDQSNLYAEQFFAKQPIIKPRSRLHSWKKKVLTVPEFFRFFALVIVMGIVRFPKMEDHWAKKWPFGSHSFRSIMSRDRFSMILKFFHVNDNSKYIRRGESGYDPLFKIRPLLESLLQNFQNSYTPNREMSIDEAMVSFKGRAWFMQYMPKKPKKWGLKAFSLADSKTGYTLNWKLYAGKLFCKASLKYTSCHHT